MNTLAHFTCFLLCGRPAAVSTYIDPSAMTYMIQLVAGIFIAAGAGFAFYFRKLKRRLFRGRENRAPQPYAAADDGDDTGYGDYELDAPAQPQTASSPPSSEPVYAPEPAPTPADPFDETGGEGGLAAENRELRRLLAQERQKVEALKQALHICTAPRK